MVTPGDDNPPADGDDDDGTVTGGGDDQGCVASPTDSCTAQLDAYADQLKAKKVRPCEFMRKMTAKMHELHCYGHRGFWMRHHNYRLTGKCDKPKPVVVKKHHKKCQHHMRWDDRRGSMHCSKCGYEKKGSGHKKSCDKSPKKCDLR